MASAVTVGARSTSHKITVTVNAKNSAGETAADMAVHNGNLEAEQAIKVMSSAKAASRAPVGEPGSSSQ